MADLTTLMAKYLVSLRTANPGKDLTTLWVLDRPTVKTTVEASGAEDDENTMYYRYLIGLYPASVLVDSPLGYWRLNDASGTVAVDSAASPHNGTYAGGVTLGQPGALGQNTAALFNGVDGYIFLPNTTLRLATNLTVETWVNPSSYAADRTVVRCGTGTDEMYWVSIGLAGTVQVGHHNGTTFEVLTSAAGVIPLNQWTYLVVTRETDGKTYKIYVNGALISTQATTAVPVVSAAQEVRVGAGAAGFFAGLIDDVAIYGTTLTGVQIAAHYAKA